MGKNRKRNKRRKYHNLINVWTHDLEEEQQESSLDKQQQRELQFSCIRQQQGESLDTVSARLLQFCQRFGPVTDVNIRSKHRNSTTSGSSSTSSSVQPLPRLLVGSFGLRLQQQQQQQQSYNQPLDATVEMATAADASRILQQRQSVMFYNRQKGQSTPQLALAASEELGYLRSSSCGSCRGKASQACYCQRYCK